MALKSSKLFVLQRLRNRLYKLYI